MHADTIVYYTRLKAVVEVLPSYAVWVAIPGPGKSMYLTALHQALRQAANP